MYWDKTVPVKSGYYWLRYAKHAKGGEVVYVGAEQRTKKLYVVPCGTAFDDRLPIADTRFNEASWGYGIELPGTEYNPPLAEAGFMDLVTQIIKVAATQDTAEVLKNRPAIQREAVIKLQLAAEHYIEVVETSLNHN